MMRVLIVEDHHEKLLLLKTIVQKPEIDIDVVSNVNDAQQKLIQVGYDLVLIDIQIPDDNISEVNPKGGVELLEWITINPRCLMPWRIFGITSNTDTEQKYSQYFISRGFYLIKSEVSNNYWLETIEKTCEYLIKEKPEDENFNFDIAIITAMSHNELKAILNLPIDWVKFNLKNDPSTYYKSEVKTSKGLKSIVASHCPRMGLSASSSHSTKMILNFEPKFIFMAGIAAGIEGKVRLGDIMVADPSWDWGSGKLTNISGKQDFQPAPHQEALDASLRQQIQNVRDTGSYLKSIKESWTGNCPDHELSIVLGPIASGAVVLEDPDVISSIVSQNRTTIGVEMEAYGVMTAARQTKKSNISSIVVKSVCDYADTNKNDNWQEYASYTSAQFIYNFILNDLYEL